MRVSLVAIAVMMATPAQAEPGALSLQWQQTLKAAQARFEQTLGVAWKERERGALAAKSNAVGSLDALRVGVSPELNTGNAGEGEVAAEVALSWKVGRTGAHQAAAKLGQQLVSLEQQQHCLRFLEEALVAWAGWVEASVQTQLQKSLVEQVTRDLAFYETQLKAGQLTWLTVSGLQSELARFELEASLQGLAEAQALTKLKPYLGYAPEVTALSVQQLHEAASQLKAEWRDLINVLEALPGFQVEALKAKQTRAQARLLGADEGASLEVGLTGKHTFDAHQNSTFAGVLLGLELPLKRSSSSEQARLRAEASAQELELQFQREQWRAELEAEAQAFELRQTALTGGLKTALSQAQTRADKLNEALKQGRIQVDAYMLAQRDVVMLEREVVKVAIEVATSALRSALWRQHLVNLGGEKQ